MSAQLKKGSLSLTCLFGAFVFLQFTVLGLANHAGEGYLTTAWRDLVYYGLQVFVILGVALHGMFFRFCAGRRSQKIVAYTVSGLFLVCGVLLFAVGRDSLFYVIVSMTAALCLGALGGAAHLRMSTVSASGAEVARCMGFGSAAAVVLQYLLQIQWGVTPLLPVVMLAAFGVFLLMLRREAPEAVPEGDEEPETAPPRRLVFAVLITVTFILFSGFYNETIHHRMIQSDYAANVYSWPRLMMVPVYLLFALAGDRQKGRYVPIVSLCITLIALLNVVLIGDAGAYWLNMCFFYFAIAAYTCYYLLTFWRLAPGTRRPALWAPFGRMLDSGMVLFTGAIHLSSLPAPVVLGADIAGVVLIIVLMAVGGNFDLTKAAPAPEIVPAPAEAPPALSQEETLERMGERYQLTPREAEVLEKLLLTEDELQAVADSLYISRRVLGRHITSIYQKTGAKSRVGLYQLFYAISREA